jgi:hypothetical protein
MKAHHLKKLAILYGLIGAGNAAYLYTKGYALDPMLILTWPMKVTQVFKAPSVPAGTPRAKLVYS